MKTFYITTGLSHNSKNVMYVLYSAEANILKFEQILADDLVSAKAKALSIANVADIQVIENPTELRNKFNPTIFSFGKYKGEDVYDVIVKDSAYCEWIRNNNNFEVKDFVTFLIKYMPVENKLTAKKIQELQKTCLRNEYNFEEAVEEILRDRANNPGDCYYTNEMFDCNIIYNADEVIENGVEYSAQRGDLAGNVKELLTDKNKTAFYYSKIAGLIAIKQENKAHRTARGEMRIVATGEMIEKFGLQFNCVKIIKKVKKDLVDLNIMLNFV